MLRFIVVCGLTILVSMTFLACQQEREETFPDNRPVVFAPLHSVWGGGAQSRAYDNTWDQGDEVGIYMLPHHTNGGSLANAIAGAANIPYKTANNNSIAGLVPATDGVTIYYPSDDSEVNFVAYYPHRNNIVNGYYPVDVLTQSSLKEIDLMIHDGVNQPYKLSDGEAVPLEFKHKLTKLVITATPKVATGIKMTDASLTISGVPTAAVCDLYSGTFTGLGIEKEIDLVLKSSSLTEAEWEALIIPHTYVDFPDRTFTIKVGNDTWEYTPVGVFDSGKVYTYNFNLE
jgi:endonuclease G